MFMMQDVIGRFTNLEYIPTSIECFHRKQSFHFADATSNVLHDMDVPIQHIAIGDAMGGVCIIKVCFDFSLDPSVISMPFPFDSDHCLLLA